MRKVSMLLLVVAMASLALTGCAKPPEEEQRAADQAIADAKSAEADTYASNELGQAQQSLDGAKAEIEAQNQKWFKNYDKAKEQLAAARTAAEQAKTAAVANKEAAKQEAEAAVAAAKTAIETAEASLKSAPVGKGTKADMELYTSDLEGAKTQIADAEAALTAGRYYDARDKAKAVSDKANQINTEVQAVIEKSGGKKRA